MIIVLRALVIDVLSNRISDYDMDSIKPSKRIRLDQQQPPAETEKNPSFATRRVRKQEVDPAFTDKSQTDNDIKSAATSVMSCDILTRAADDILGSESLLPANPGQEDQGTTSSQSTTIDSLTRAAEGVLYGGSLPPNPQRGIAFFEKMPMEERYRFLVDEKILFDEKGASLFAEREPGCLKGGAMVYQKIVSLLRDGITPIELLDKEYLKELHKTLFQPTRLLSVRGKTKKLQSAGEFRSKRVYIRVMNNFTKKGLCEAQDFHKKICPNTDWIKGIFQVDVYQSDSEHARKVVHKYAPDATDVPKYIKDPKCIVDFQPVSHKYKALEEIVETYLSDARKKLENVSKVSELIGFLAEFSAQLDQMHPFENGNIRIIRALVDFILMYFGHSPIIWYDPNIIDFYDIELLAGIMKNSIEASEKQIEALAQGRRRKATYKSNDADKKLSLAAFSKDSSSSKDSSRASPPPTSNKT